MSVAVAVAVPAAVDIAMAEIVPCAACMCWAVATWTSVCECL